MLDLRLFRNGKISKNNFNEFVKKVYRILHPQDTYWKELVSGLKQRIKEQNQLIDQLDQDRHSNRTKNDEL